MRNPYLPDFSLLAPHLGKLRKLFIMMLCTLVVITVYITIIRAGSEIFYTAFYILTGVFACAVVFLNGGFSKELPRKEDLREDWSDEKKTAFINRLKKNKERAKVLMYFLVPMMGVVFFDIIWVLFLDF